MKNLKLYEKVSELIKNNKRAIIAGSLVGVMMLSTGCKKNADKETLPTETPIASEKLENIESITSELENIEEINDSSKLENIEERFILTAENIDKEALKIVANNEKKGLFITEDKVKSALFITNIDSFEAEDIYSIFGYKLDGIEDENTRIRIIAEEIQNMYDYCSSVRTHNNNGKEYISMSQLVYSETDRAIINALDNEYTKLTKSLDKISAEDFQKSFKYITEFYLGNGYIKNDKENYSNYSLSSGGGLLAEMYWPMYSVAYNTSEHLTSENTVEIKSLSNVINGSKYLGSIMTIADNCTNNYTEDKTLIK